MSVNKSQRVTCWSPLPVPLATFLPLSLLYDTAERVLNKNRGREGRTYVSIADKAEEEEEEEEERQQSYLFPSYCITFLSFVGYWFPFLSSLLRLCFCFYLSVD